MTNNKTNELINKRINNPFNSQTIQNSHFNSKEIVQTKNQTCKQQYDHTNSHNNDNRQLDRHTYLWLIYTQNHPQNVQI